MGRFFSHRCLKWCGQDSNLRPHGYDNNAIKLLQLFSEESGRDNLMACLRRKSLPGRGLLTLSLILRPDGVQASAVFDRLFVQSLVVQLANRGCESDRHRAGEVLP